MKKEIISLEIEYDPKKTVAPSEWNWTEMLNTIEDGDITMLSKSDILRILAEEIEGNV